MQIGVLRTTQSELGVFLSVSIRFDNCETGGGDKRVGVNHLLVTMAKLLNAKTLCNVPKHMNHTPLKKDFKFTGTLCNH